MAASKVNLKLLIDKSAKRVLFAEAGKDFVDFLFNILSLPVGTVIRLVAKKEMVGCLGNLYESVEKLDETYMQPNQKKESLLKPKTPTWGAQVPLLSLEDVPTERKKYYMCSSQYQVHYYVTDNPQNTCPGGCGYKMSKELPFVSSPAEIAVSGEGTCGYVKGVVTYMVMDDLNVMPMSTISSITLLNKFNIKDVSGLEERVVHLDMAKGVELLKASMESKMVLTTVFLGQKGT